MGYIIACVLAAVCVALCVYIRRLRKNLKETKHQYDITNFAARVCNHTAIQKTLYFDALRNGIDQPLVVYANGKKEKNPAASRLEGERPGLFTCDGRQYEGRWLIEEEMLLLRDVTEQGEAERMRQELTANVSHELKTPLHAISGYAEMMTQGMVKPEDIAGFAGNIYKEAGRMIRLVEDILSLSSIDSGSGYEWETVDLHEKVLQVVSQLQPVAQKANVSVIVSGRSSPVWAIDQLLGMLIHNLVDNAIKYNHPGGRVEIQAVGNALTVVDTGIGIPREAQSRIFERFYRVDKSRSKAVGGTGLGLSIVKHAARVMNATISLQSDEGQGTTVTVKFDEPA